MSLPNATSILSTLPSGIRATVSRGGVVATYAVRTAINESGSLSQGGLERFAKTNVWTVCADFSPRISVGDVLKVGGLDAFVVDAMTSCANLISKANVVLCEDVVTVGDLSFNCQLGMVSQEFEPGLTGFLPDDTQGFFVPESIIPEGVELDISTAVVIAGKNYTVAKVSRDARYGILCVTCKGGAE